MLIIGLEKKQNLICLLFRGMEAAMLIIGGGA